MTRRTTAEVLLNAAARTLVTRDLVADIPRYFSVCGVRANVQLLRDGRELETAARRALDAKPDVVVAGGRDGTMSAVATVRAGTGMPLGVLPLRPRTPCRRGVGRPRGKDAGSGRGELVVRGRRGRPQGRDVVGGESREHR